MSVFVNGIVTAFSLAVLAQSVACANESSMQKEEAQRIATVQLDAARVMLDVWSSNDQSGELNQESLEKMSRYVLVTMTIANLANLEVQKIPIRYVETLCIAGLPETRGFYAHVQDGSLKNEALSYLERTRDSVLARIKERQTVYGGTGCLIVPAVERN
ncbi:MAG: hypothetical protein AAFY26_25690 [Cyanobacteria bacterium J06638_22]